MLSIAILTIQSNNFYSEYLATFKKTVAMHEVFLTRLASHSIFREDSHLHVFLEYDQDLCARPKGKLQQLGGLVKSIGNTTDQYYLNATVRDVNDFFEQQMNSLTEYHNQLKEATSRTDKMTEKHKGKNRFFQNKVVIYLFIFCRTC